MRPLISGLKVVALDRFHCTRMHRFDAVCQECKKIADDYSTKRHLRMAIAHWKGEIDRLPRSVTLGMLNFIPCADVYSRSLDVKTLQTKWANERKQKCFDVWKTAAENRQAEKMDQIASRVSKVVQPQQVLHSQ